MRVTPVQLDIPFGRGAVGYVRGEGLHMSDIYGALFKTLEPERFDTGKPLDPMRLEYGLAFEEMLEEALKTRLDTHSDIDRPGELVEPEHGILYSPDLIIFNGHTRVGEVKLTWMSTKDVPVEECRGDSLFPQKFDKYFVQMKAYCVAGDTRILTDDLRWTRADTLRTGDGLFAFDENPTTQNYRRRWRKATVTQTRLVKRPSFELTMEDGSVLVCSADHMWLTSTTPTSRFDWMRTENFPWHKDVYIQKPLEPWQSPTTYDAGYLAGIFDGEGYICQIKTMGSCSAVLAGMSQNPGDVLERVKALTKSWSFAQTPTYQRKCQHLILRKFSDIVQFLGAIRPGRLMQKFVAYDRFPALVGPRVRVAKVRSIGKHLVYALSTDSSTYVAEGFASHNCYCLQTEYARLMAYFVNGSYNHYRGGDPLFKAWDIEFTPRELRENWQLLMAFAKQRKMI